jgi:hypothetical protein
MVWCFWTLKIGHNEKHVPEYKQMMTDVQCSGPSCQAAVFRTILAHESTYSQEVFSMVTYVLWIAVLTSTNTSVAKTRLEFLLSLNGSTRVLIYSSGLYWPDRCPRSRKLACKLMQSDCTHRCAWRSSYWPGTFHFTILHVTTLTVYDKLIRSSSFLSLLIGRRLARNSL